MPRLSRAHEHARTRINDLAASALPASRLASQVAVVLEEAIGWDGFRVFGLDSRTMLVNALLAASENDADARLEWLREVYLAIPTQYAELPELARSGLTSVAFQERQDECWGLPRGWVADVEPDAHYRHYHEFRSPVGGTILAIFREQERPVAAMQAYRRDVNRPFRRGDVQFVQMMSRTIGGALSVAMERDAALATVEASAASGILMVDAAGSIQLATPAGERWLTRLGPRDGNLPVPVWAAMAAQRKARREEARVVSVRTGQGVIRVEVSSAGETGQQAVVISGAHEPEGVAVPGGWGLTQRETEVVEQLALGKNNREIAQALYVGDSTVEWHLRQVYEKLGVKSRQEVLAALFRQTVLPGIVRTVSAQA